MSLFTTLSDMSKQHADNSGSYTFIVSDYKRKTESEIRAEVKKEMQEEPEPTVSLYNLLDHSPQDLRNLAIAVRDQVRGIEEIKMKIPDTYTSLCAWATILESAIKERHVRDSEAWAEKTAKEIVFESKCTGDCYFLPVGGPYSPVTRKKCETCGIIKD